MAPPSRALALLVAMAAAAPAATTSSAQRAPWTPPLSPSQLHPPHARVRVRAQMRRWATVAPPTGHTFSPIDFGGDPTGATDSTAAVAAAVAALLGACSPSGVHSPEGMRDCNGASIDLEGGVYLVSAPLEIPPGFANLRVTSGSLIASTSFSADRFLIEVGGTTGSNIDVSLEGLFLDAYQVAAGCIRTQTLCGGIIGPQVYATNFSKFGVQVIAGFEVTIMQTWAAEFWWSDSRKENGTASVAVGIAKDGNDGDVNDVVVFSSRIGLVINGEANSVDQVHTWNLADAGGGIGILVNVSQTRITNCYLDWNDVVLAQPSLISFTSGLFLCGARIRLVAPPSGVASGVFISNNVLVGEYCKMGAPVVEAQGVFTSVTDVTIAGTLAEAIYQPRSTVATLVVAASSPTSSFVADFTQLLLFDTAHVPIKRVTYTVTLDAGVAPVAHAARPAVGGVVTIDVAAPVTGSVTVTVDQSARTGP